MIRNFTSVEKIYDTIDNTFSCYKVILNDVVSFVPLDEANTDYQAIMEYIENGGVVIDNGGGE
jgi:hypothetical protein